MQTLSTHPKVSPTQPTQSRYKYSSLNNIPANPTFNDTASAYNAPFGLDHIFYNKTATAPISRTPNTNTQETKERGGHNKWNTTLLTKYADFIINIPGRRVEKNKLKYGSGVAFKVISPTPRAFPVEVGEEKKGTSG